MFSTLYNYFYPTNNYYGWKRGKKWENALNDQEFSILFSYYNSYSDIKYIDLRNRCPKVYNQGELGSCTANALAFGYEYTELIEKKNNEFIPSRLFIYYNEREIENSVKIDSGAELFDGIYTLKYTGVCPETKWEYNISKFTEKPPKECYEEAKQNKIDKYYAITQHLEQIKSALIKGFPVVFGFVVYSSFESKEVAKTGFMTMPTENDTILGGHAVAAVGFDDTKKIIIVRNSWGEEWGDNGYFYMPYEYITNPKLASDFWCITHST